MPPLPVPFYREAGAGPGVLCLHANASSSAQWRALMESLALRFHLLASDLYGAGQSPQWPGARPLSLRDEAALLEPLFERAGVPCVLVGHSYGAAVALVAAVSQPQRISALVLYEPTLFSLLDANAPPPNEADGIRTAVAAAVAALDDGNEAGAAECFIDYWMGQGAFQAMPASRQGPIASAVTHVRDWAHALLTEPTPLAAFSRLTMPVLYMIGKDSPVSSRGVGRLLTRVLPRVQLVEFEALGHMGPVTHPALVNQCIASFLERA
jgi:pimeloyl-ACP methyl ester carboxylesterase